MRGLYVHLAQHFADGADHVPDIRGENVSDGADAETIGAARLAAIDDESPFA